MPKLVLIQPPVEDFYDTDIRLQPIGLCYLKAAVKKHCPEFAVKVMDFHQGRGRATVPIPKELSYLKKYYSISDSSLFRSFHQYFRFGAPYDVIAQEVAREQPDIVGISANFTPYFREALKCAEAIKKKSGAIIVMGGSHVSACPEIITDRNVDFIIRGEGERPLVEFLSTWRHGHGFAEVPNLGFMKNGKKVLNPLQDNFPTDDLPAPDLKDLPVKRYLYRERPVCMIVTSRGCPHKCSFCTVHQTFGKRYRPRSVQNVVTEMKERYAQGYRVFDFEDDNLTFLKSDIIELCKRITEAFPQQDIELLAMNGVSYQSLDDEILAAMRQAGFTNLNLALVSSNEQVLAELGRPHRVQKFFRVVERAHELGFHILAHQILGLPNESMQSMIDSLVFLAKHPVLIGVSVFYLIPGAPIAAGFPPLGEVDLVRARSTAMAVETEHCKRLDLSTLFITARIINFLKGLDIEHETSFEDVMKLRVKAVGREAAALKILTALFSEKRLYAATGKGLVPVSAFDAALFFRIWENLDVIITQSGNRMILKYPKNSGA